MSLSYEQIIRVVTVITQLLYLIPDYYTVQQANWFVKYSSINFITYLPDTILFAS